MKVNNCALGAGEGRGTRVCGFGGGARRTELRLGCGIVFGCSGTVVLTNDDFRNDGAKMRNATNATMPVSIHRKVSKIGTSERKRGFKSLGSRNRIPLGLALAALLSYLVLGRVIVIMVS